jgi:1-acyl-sn-glycerol-3-phosphate acyltransferase
MYKSEHLERGKSERRATMWALALGGFMAAGLLVNWRRSGQPALDFFCLGIMRLYARLYHNVYIRPPIWAPPRGGALVIANHTCSADPAFLQACFSRLLCFLVAEEYFDIPGVNWIFRYTRCIPVARHCRDVRSVRTALRRLKEGRIVCLFPEGSLSGTGRGRLRAAKRGAALLALQSGVPVYPAFILGGPQHTHVPSAWLLPSRARVILGQPIDLAPYGGRKRDRKLIEEVGAHLMRQITALDPRSKQRRKPLAPWGENPYDRKRRRTRKKALSAV